MINKLKLRKSLFLTFGILILLFLFSSKISIGAEEGDLIWAELVPGSWTNAYGVAVDSTGVYISGYSGTSMQLEKRDIYSGDPNPIWPSPILVNLGEAVYEVTETAVDSTNVYTIYSRDGNINNKWCVEKRDRINGNHEWTQCQDFSWGRDNPQAIDIDSTGIYITGWTNNNDTWRVEKRHLTNGNVDWGTNINIPALYEAYYPEAIAVDSGGIYIAGGVLDYSGVPLWRVLKMSLDGNLIIWDKIDNVGVSIELQIDNNGVYVGGYEEISPFIWRIKKYNKTDGLFVWQNSDTYDGLIKGIGISSTGVYAVGAVNNRAIWRVEKRDSNNGNLLWEEPLSGFGPYTVQQTDFFDNGLYVVGSQQNCSSWRIEKRIKISESNGPPVANPGGPYEISQPASQVALDGSGSTDPDDDILEYNWSITNNNANCNPINPIGVTPLINCTSVGQSDITLTVTDPAGLSNAQSTTITVNGVNNPPTAAISCNHSPCSVYKGAAENIILTNNSTDPDSTNCPSPCNTDINTSKWYIGPDFTTPKLTCGVCDFTPQNFPPANNIGNYTAKLCVEDSVGNYGETTQDFQIKEDISAEFNCSLTGNGFDWQSCEALPFSFVSQKVYFKDISQASEGSSINSREWYKNLETSSFSGIINPSLNSVLPSTQITLKVTDDAGRTDSATQTIGGKLFLPKWREIIPF
jgi:hypothetical protein